MRSDDFDTFGCATMAWLVVPQALEFCANYFSRMTADLCAVDVMRFYA